MVAGSTRQVPVDLSRQEACPGMALLIAIRCFPLPKIIVENDRNEVYRHLGPCEAAPTALRAYRFLDTYTKMGVPITNVFTQDKVQVRSRK